MMYHMKKIISHDDEVLLPKCMYIIKNQNEYKNADEIDINISNQAPNKKMTELEQRQDQLLTKLDILYERIKIISSYCNLSSTQQQITSQMNMDPNKQSIAAPDEIVVVASPDNLPWFLNILLKKSSFAVNVAWHIHSSVPNEKVPKIKAYVKKLQNVHHNATMNLRLIFKCVSADTELKLTSLAFPIVGNVNILRYLSFIYPSIIPYDQDDFNVDSLLDVCHLFERTPEKNKEVFSKKLFSQHKDWIYNNEFSIVDIAAYSAVKQWHNGSKFVPKNWFDKCEKNCV